MSVTGTWYLPTTQNNYITSNFLNTTLLSYENVSNMNANFLQIGGTGYLNTLTVGNTTQGTGYYNTFSSATGSNTNFTGTNLLFTTQTGTNCSITNITGNNGSFTNLGIGINFQIPSISTTVTQLTSISTAVTTTGLAGKIALFGQQRAAQGSTTFTMNNSNITSTSMVLTAIASTGVRKYFTSAVAAIANGSCQIAVQEVAISNSSVTNGCIVSYLIINNS